jgi:hypothetical protein
MGEWKDMKQPKDFEKPVEVKPAEPGEQPKPGKPANLESTCPAPGVFGAVDLSQYCTQRFLDTMKYLGVKTILRYYDIPGSPTLREKIPTTAELALIKKNGFQFCGVFQHNNSKLASFTALRGASDAQVVLGLAAKWGQPKGSGVYFGVDFDPSESEMSHVKEYAKEFSKIIKGAGFRVGAYGSGLTLESLLAAGYIELAWLSMSTGFRHSKEFAASNRWHLQQVLDRDCGGINCDFDYVNPSNPDFGQWEL